MYTDTFCKVQFSYWCTLDQTGDLSNRQIFKEQWLLKQEVIQLRMCFLGQYYIEAGQARLLQV